MSAEWVKGIVSESIKIYGRPEILNSDQGSQFTSDVHISLLKKEGIRISMDGKGRAIDNIFIESLWRSVKYEHVYLYAYSDGVSLYNCLEEYFEFSSHKRIHQSVIYETPARRYMICAA